MLILGGAILLAILLWVSSRRVNHLVEAQRGLIGDLDRSREQEARGKAELGTILRSIGDAVIATDRSGRIRFINVVAEQLTGWRSGEAEDRMLGDVFRVVDEGTRIPAAEVSTSAPGEMRTIGEAGAFCWFRGTGGRFRWSTAGRRCRRAMGRRRESRSCSGT